MFKTSLLTAAALLATSPPAFAQQPPSAGGQLGQIPPAAASQRAAAEIKIERSTAAAQPVADGPRVRVDSLRVTGGTLFPEAELIAAAAVAPTSELTLSELRSAAARVTAYYNTRGYFLAQTYVPAQDVKNGAVTLAVVEGRYGKIDIRNRSGLADGRATRLLSGLDSGEAVAHAALERRLLLLSDIPGVRVRSTMAPGAAVGTSDLVIDIDPGRRVTGSIEADNAGNRYTGALRAGGSVNLNNPAGLGDLFTVRLLASEGGLAYGRAAYQAPVGSGQLGAAYTHLRYELGREFEGLDADGSADILGVFGSYPVVRSRDADLHALAGVDVKQLEDRIGLASSVSEKQATVATVGFSGDSRDGFGTGGRNEYSAGLALGDLQIESPLERAADALTARSDGGFSKLYGSVARLQSLGGPLSVFAALRGQVAFNNLDISEKMELGGAYGVRAYPEGEAYGDQGYVATLEARLMLRRWASTLPGELQLIGFVDAGEVAYSADPWSSGSNHAHRSGAGAGFAWAGPHGLTLKASYARKLGDAQATSAPDEDGRAWFHISKSFR
ncbi:MAG TPA: ShlB/FhaC/HecB family hemolysin secretion/activation protein [Caulobacteraceae bacterium]|jgi:hemolysin activation/secretion protein